MILPSATVIRPSVSPWQYTLSHTCHAKEVEPTGRPGVYPTPLGSAYCPTPAMQKQKRWSPRDARACIRFLGSAYYPISAPHKIYIVPCLPRKRAGTQGTPGYIFNLLPIHIIPYLPYKKDEIQGTAKHVPNPLAIHIIAKKANAKAYIRFLRSIYCSIPIT